MTEAVNQEIHQFIPNGPKILVLDIETSPTLAYVWKAWKENVQADRVVQKGVMLTWSAKFAGHDMVFSDANMNHGDDPFDDKQTTYNLLTLIDNADMIVTYNGKMFDIPVFQARCLHHGFPPPSPVKHIDLFQTVKREFRLFHRSLNAVADALGVGTKVNTGGFQLWADCMKGDQEAWGKMLEYNIQDAHLTEEVYRYLRPWIKNHPNVNPFREPDEDERPRCPKCGGDHIHFRGYATTAVSTYKRFQCMNCGGWGRLRIREKDKPLPAAVNEL